MIWPPSAGAPTSRDPIYDEDGLQREVIARCERTWRHERGGGLTDDARDRLAPLVRGALRYLASSDVIETMTTGTRTARDLGAVLATRLRGVIKAGRRARAIQVDEHRAERGRQEAAELAAERFARPSVVTARQAARAAADAAQRAGRARPGPARAEDPSTAGPSPTRPTAAVDEPVTELDPAEVRALWWATRNAQASRSNSTTTLPAG